MPDLRTLLHEAADAGPLDPALACVDDDLARGRRALTRRRLRRAVTPTGLLAAVAAGLLVVGPQLTAPSAPIVTPLGAATVGPSTSGTVLTAGISLVAYAGNQPAGYTIDKVPQGWEIQNVDRYSLVIAPIGAKDQDPNSFEGKILIGKANPDEVAVQRDGVKLIKVGGVTARFFTFSDPVPQSPSGSGSDAAAQGLLLPTGKNAFLIFQLPGSLHWDAATVADFAAGVHMQPGAKAAAG
jgi:hypothetical protein